MHATVSLHGNCCFKLRNGCSNAMQAFELLRIYLDNPPKRGNVMFKRNLPVIEESHLKRHAFIKVTYRVKNCPVEMINTVINVMSKKIKQDSVKFT
ncbi:hypothetical protein T03_17181 [Trichinella britovi]|uniref:Uncharacterized protein n=1 Tax=Trichinella britovi TaxID=45882 RepID=A0A0V1DAW7_TRIBR|nr:hypothetical protein T03_17181 [Trichinella britovi]